MSDHGDAMQGVATVSSHSRPDFDWAAKATAADRIALVTIGSADNETLDGTALAYILDGGTGTDDLRGGAGTDTYVFTAAFGQDTIVDADGQGALQVEGFAGGLPIGRKQADGIYRSDDGQVVYTLIATGSGRFNLRISFAGNQDSEITLRNWSTARSLGITLDETIVVPTTAATYNGEFAKAVSGDAYVLTATGYASAGPAPDAPDVLNGTSGADLLTGGGNALALRAARQHLASRICVLGSAAARRRVSRPGTTIRMRTSSGAELHWWSEA